MKLKVDFIENDISFSNDSVVSIEIENKKYFYRFVKGLHDFTNGLKPEEYQFYDDENKEINPSIQIFLDYFSFDIETKKTTTELYKNIMNNVDENASKELINNYKKIYTTLSKTLRNIDLPLVIQQEFDLETLLKAFKVSIQKKEELLDNLLLLIDVEKLLKIHTLQIFVNLKQYLTKEELIEFYKYAIYNNVQILLVDSQTYGISLNNEKKLVIDENLDEFML